MMKWFRARRTQRVSNFLLQQTHDFDRAQILVGFYYIALLFLSISSMPDWPEMLERKMIAPLWPVAWLDLVSLPAGTALILILYLTGTFLGAIFPSRLWARLLAFLGVFQFVAFNNSFGKIGHSMHLWVLTSFLLVFLARIEPANDTPRVQRQEFLLIVRGCQAIVLLAYSMSGLGKLLGGFYQVFRGQLHIFLPSSFSLIVAERLQQTNSVSLLGSWLIAHPLAGWPFMIADLYLQTFSFWVAFRPALHRWWAIGLILFHIASYLFLGINFAPTALLIAILLLNSPFARATDGWRHALSDLPLFGIILRRCVS
jgi:hypothetical protein